MAWYCDLCILISGKVPGAALSESAVHGCPPCQFFGRCSKSHRVLLQVGKLHPSKPEEEAKADLIKQLDDYLEVCTARCQIQQHVSMRFAGTLVTTRNLMVQLQPLLPQKNREPQISCLLAHRVRCTLCIQSAAEKGVKLLLVHLQARTADTGQRTYTS